MIPRGSKGDEIGDTGDCECECECECDCECAAAAVIVAA